MAFSSLRKSDGPRYEFKHVEFSGLDVTRTVYFNAGDVACKELGYLPSDLRRVRNPEPCMHVMLHYVYAGIAAEKAKNKELLYRCQSIVTHYAHKCVGQVDKKL